MISTKAAFVAAIATSSALALSACGGSSDKSASEVGTSPSASASSTPSAAPSAAPSSAAATGDSTGAALPSNEELASIVSTLIVRTTTPAERAAHVIGGADLTPTLVKLDNYLKDFKVTFKVEGQSLTGKTLKGNVRIYSGGRPFPNLYPAFWQQKGSEWQLTRSGACSLIAVSSITCPDAPAS